ncbi:MAG: Rne/Rng family ribonuclease [Candidatus Omnitrophica bacterium]|nr:Rne/Rng family ribonuclease [Candidatus Omnitrophota bacterium]
MGKVKEIFISTEAQESRVAITEDKRLEEFYAERTDDQRLVGSIFKGRVTSIVPGIGAAFVDIGLGKNGFLYVSDIIEPPPEEEAILEGDPQPPPRHHEHRPRSRIEELVKVNQEILVQVVKEPFGTKGARLTTHLSLAGRYIVLMCHDSRLGISKRIDDPKERARLREILGRLRFSPEVGFIVRTAAAGKGEKEFTRDVRYLNGLWQQVKRQERRAKAPLCIHQEYDLAPRVIRDSFTEDVHRIILDSKTEIRRLSHFLRTLIPGVRVRLDFYQGQEPLFEREGLEEQIAALFEKRVELPSGGVIVIEPTESLVAIDVNSGRFTGRRNLEDTVFHVNKEAAVEVARQLRLRDVGGIVVIDFIDMEDVDRRREVVRILEEALGRDRAKTNLVSFSEICLAELTRQRMRRSFETVSYQSCPYCGGRGAVKSVVTMAIQAIRQAKRALKGARGKTLELFVHPQVALRLLQEDRASLSAIEQLAHAKILVMSDPSMHLEQIKAQLTS